MTAHHIDREILDVKLPAGIFDIGAHLREIQRITEPGDRVFDLVGMYFREDAYQPFTMPWVVMQQQALTGSFPVLHERLHASPPVAWIGNYRTVWLCEEAKRFLLENYVHHAGRIHVLGQQVSLKRGESTRFVALQSRRYIWEGTGVLRVDGRRFSSGTLSASEHRVTADTGSVQGRLRIQLPDGMPSPVLLVRRPLFVGFT